MTIKNYTIGFVLSLVLTLVAYFAVVNEWAAGLSLLLILGLLAVAQMIVQLIYFLHLGEESRPRYRLLSFVFMAGILLIIVVGSVWIMHSLDYNMMNMTPDEKTQYMMTQHDKGF